MEKGKLIYGSITMMSRLGTMAKKSRKIDIDQMATIIAAGDGILLLLKVPESDDLTLQMGQECNEGDEL